MLSRVKRWLRRNYVKVGVMVLLLAQTDNTTTTTTFDYSSITNIIVAVIPLFVLVAIIKLLFRSFKDVA